VSAGDLADAHDANLVDGPFTNVANGTVRYANGTLCFRSNRTAQVANATGPFYRVAQFEESLPYPYPDRLRTWSNGEQVVTDGNITYTLTQNPTRSDYDFRNSMFLTLFTALETRVVGQETRNGTELHRVRATNLTNSEYLPTPLTIAPAQNPRNISFRALVDSQGIVRSYSLAYTATVTQRGANTTYRITQSARWTDIGSTTVERPAWYEAANRSTTAGSAGLVRPSAEQLWTPPRNA